jgi:hypothetical protein
MAPVKMRAAVPGSRGWPTLPAGMRWATSKVALPQRFVVMQADVDAMKAYIAQHTGL